MSALSTRVAADDLQVGQISETGDLKRLEALLAGIWGRHLPPISRDLMQALRLNGSYVAGAFVGTELIGGLVGFLGVEDGNAIHLHSHILGVRADAQVRGVGYALKQHQRSWALARGIATVTWTFDPLVRRNAYFNVSKLGADVAAYHTNLYDSMGDEINGDGESDRLLARWNLTSRRALDGTRGVIEEPQVHELLGNGAAAALRDDGGAPIVGRLHGDVAVIRIPEDIVQIRAVSPRLADEWRRALRMTLGDALAAGWRVAGMTRSGWYVLSRGVGDTR